MMFDGPSFTEQMNEITAENEHNAEAVEEMESVIDDLNDEIDALQADNDYMRKLIADALSDLSTLSEVPLNLVESAIENIMDDLRKGL